MLDNRTKRAPFLLALALLVFPGVAEALGTLLETPPTIVEPAAAPPDDSGIAIGALVLGVWLSGSLALAALWATTGWVIGRSKT